MKTLANFTSPAKVVAGTTATAELRAVKTPLRWYAYLAAFLAAALLSTEAGFLARQGQDVVKNWLGSHSVAARATQQAATALVSTPQPRTTDRDLEAISHLAPQQQAERLLGLAIEQPDLALSLIRRNLASWRGHLEASGRSKGSRCWATMPQSMRCSTSWPTTRRRKSASAPRTGFRSRDCLPESSGSRRFPSC